MYIYTAATAATAAAAAAAAHATLAHTHTHTPAHTHTHSPALRESGTARAYHSATFVPGFFLKFFRDLSAIFCFFSCQGPCQFCPHAVYIVCLYACMHVYIHIYETGA